MRSSRPRIAGAWTLWLAGCLMPITPGRTRNRANPVWCSPRLTGRVCSLRPLAPEASATAPENAGFSLLIGGILRGSRECAILPVCGEFGRVWAHGALRLPNAERLAGPARSASKQRVGAVKSGPRAGGTSARPQVGHDFEASPPAAVKASRSAAEPIGSRSVAAALQSRVVSESMATVIARMSGMSASAATSTP